MQLQFWCVPGGSDGKRICLSCRRPGFDPSFGKIPWRRTWQPTPVLLPGEAPWTKEPGGLQSMGSQRVGRNWATKYSTWEENLPTLDPISRPTHFSQALSLLLLSFLPLQFPLCLPLAKTNKQTNMYSFFMAQYKTQLIHEAFLQFLHLVFSFPPLQVS